MIAGVFDPRGPDAVRSWLSRVEEISGLKNGCIRVKGSAGLGAWLRGELMEGATPDFASLGGIGGAESLTLEQAPRLRGSFSAIGFDPEGLVLARGRFGGRPLYYLRDGETIAACSRLTPLLALHPAVTSLEPDDLARALAASSFGEHVEATPFKAVARARSGEVVRVTARAAVGRRIWRRQEPLVGVRPEEIASEVRELFQKAVARAVQSTRRVAVFVGGGLDSSMLLAATVAASRGAAPREVAALTLDFDGPGSDRPYLRQLAAALGIVPIRQAPAQCARYVRPTMVVDGAPMPMLGAAWEASLLEVARSRGASLVLKGVGGDDVFDGDFRVFAERAGRGDILGAVSNALRLQTYFRRSPWSKLRMLVASPLARRAFPALVAARRESARRRRAQELDWAGGGLRRFLSRQPAPAQFLDHVGLGTDERLHALDTSDYLLEYSDWTGRLDAMFGCTSVDPFLDEDLVDFASRIPAEMFFYGDRLRGLLREAMRGLVPDAVRLRRDKSGFEPALFELFDCIRNEPWVRDLLSMRELERLGFVDPPRFRQAFARMDRDGNWYSLWAPVALEAFVRAVRDGTVTHRGLRAPEALGLRHDEASA